MPSSNYNQISHIMDIIMRTRPESLLDIGVGFGKFGFLCREYLELWDGRDVYGQWQRRIDGIEVCEKYITPLQKMIYNNIYIGNALEVLPTLDYLYDVILIIDVLEHFDVEDGIRLLEECHPAGAKYSGFHAQRYFRTRGGFRQRHERHRFQWKKEHFQSPNMYVINHPTKLIMYFSAKPLEEPAAKGEGRGMGENRKPLVVLLGRADWAGSCYSVSRAINQTGRMECRHVSLYPHIFGFPADIVIPICNVPNARKATDYPREYEKARTLFKQADIIHIWNDLPHVFDNLLPVPGDKIKSCTFAGNFVSPESYRHKSPFNSPGVETGSAKSHLSLSRRIRRRIYPPCGGYFKIEAAIDKPTQDRQYRLLSSGTP